MKAGLFEQDSGFVRCSIGVEGNKDDAVLPWWRVGGVFWEGDLCIGKMLKIDGKIFRVVDVVCEYVSNQAVGIHPNVFQVTLDLVTDLGNWKAPKE